MKKQLGILEVKQAFFADSRFRELFPELQKEIDEALSNPTCACNRSLYDKFFEYPDRLKDYFPNREVASITERVSEMSKNNWSVINCNINELETFLKKLPPGRKQIAISRYENQCTVIVNELDLIF